MTALVYVSVVLYQLSQDHLIRNDASHRCELYAVRNLWLYIPVCCKLEKPIAFKR